jgi:Mrp family chromosome partitioning ATPase
MNASLGILQTPIDIEDESLRVQEVRGPHATEWDAQRFAHEQIQGLIRQVFLPGFPRPARQVVFSAADPHTKTASLCLRTAAVMAAEYSLRVCVVEADFQARSLEKEFGGTSTGGRDDPELAGAVRMSSLQITNHLRLVPAEEFLGTAENALSASWLRSRIGALRREFDYALFHAPSLGRGSGASLLGHLTDGLVLVIEAHRTRRTTAQAIHESLQSSNLRLLGAVLSERRFPIPEGLYRRL